MYHYVYGLLHASVIQTVIIALILTQITLAAVTLYLHRCQSHRSIDLHPIISHFFRFWLWLTTGMITKHWVAVHRRHHVSPDKPGDPHSPVVFGLNTILLRGAELYSQAACDQALLEQYGRGTPDDWLERHVYRHNNLGIAFMFVLDITLFGVYGITLWAVQMLWIPVFAAGVINGIGHAWGYRNFAVSDSSRNIIPWGIFICGEELHNNHHAFGHCAKLSMRWWEFDLGWFYIQLLQLFGLAKVNRLAPKLIHISGKSIVDTETLKAVFTAKCQLLSQYRKLVTLPVLQAERLCASRRGREMLSYLKSLLLREENLSESAAKAIQPLLERYQSLKLVYQYRLRLQAIWEQTSLSQLELLEALQEWCRQAEQAGVGVLNDFVARLRGYVLVPVSGTN